MSVLRVFVLTITVFLGILPTTTDGTCTYSQVHGCISISKTEINCPMYRKIIKCYEELKPKCTGVVLTLITFNYNYFKSQLEICPGLPDGSCLFSQARVCRKEINNFRPTTDGCKKLGREYPKTLTCFHNMGPHCATVKGREYIAKEIAYLNGSSTSCSSVG